MPAARIAIAGPFNLKSKPLRYPTWHTVIHERVTVSSQKEPQPTFLIETKALLATLQSSALLILSLYYF